MLFRNKKTPSSSSWWLGGKSDKVLWWIKLKLKFPVCLWNTSSLQSNYEPSLTSVMYPGDSVILPQSFVMFHRELVKAVLFCIGLWSFLLPPSLYPHRLSYKNTFHSFPLSSLELICSTIHLLIKSLSLQSQRRPFIPYCSSWCQTDTTQADSKEQKYRHILGQLPCISPFFA